MLGQGWFYDENGNPMHKDDVGVPNPGEGPPARPLTRTPITRTRIPLRKIGGASPGWWEDLKAQLAKVPIPVYVVGGFGLILALVVAKGGKGTWLQKV